MRKSSYHVLAISAGKAGEKTEDLLRQALDAVQRHISASIELIRVGDYEIGPCTGCNGCLRRLKQGDASGCIKKDGFQAVVDRVKHADAIILGIPSHDGFPPAETCRLLNRCFGIGRGYEDDCWATEKFGAVIATGDNERMSFILPLGEYFLNFFHRGIKIVDLMNGQWNGRIDSDAVALNRARAQLTGEKLAQALTDGTISLPAPELYYAFPAAGTLYRVDPCPGCGNGLVRMSGNQMTCAVCNSKGAFEVRDGVALPVWNEESVRVNATRYEGEMVHRQNVDGRTSRKAALRPGSEVKAAMEPLLQERVLVKPQELVSNSSGKRLVGLAAGRVRGNTETVMRAALLEAKKANPELQVELIRLRDLDIKDCCRCGECAKNSDGSCVNNESDFAWLKERLQGADGILIGAPAYSLITPSEMVRLLQRCAGLGSAYYCQRAKKPVVGGIFCVSGGPRHIYAWESEAFLLERLCPGVMMTQRQEFTYISEPGQIIFDEEKMSRARAMGREMAKALLGEEEKLEAVQGVCPHCGCMDLELHDDGSFCCPMCQSFGRLNAVGDRAELSWAEASFPVKGKYSR